MDKTKINMLDLERELTKVESNAKQDETNNAEWNYGALESELNEIHSKIPYPDTKRFETGCDYEDTERLNFEKDRNKPFWDKESEVKEYFDKGSLYVGHVKVDDKDFYIMENASLKSKEIVYKGRKAKLVEADDYKYRDVVRSWRFPTDNNDVVFSRNVSMSNKKVSNVEVRLDRSNDFYDDISDAYLRKALIRNKENPDLKSIVQTIQKKQDDIRLIPKDKSFVVQGCAGSGKTMVLLHRLRYLLYNHDIDNDDYVFLIPSSAFKEFVGGIADKFNIKENNILSYQQFYRKVVGKTSLQYIDLNELVFPKEYLSRIYSREFIQEVYQELFDSFYLQLEGIISCCDEMLSGLLESKQKELQLKLKNKKKETLSQIIALFGFIMNDVKLPLKNYQDISSFMDEVREIKTEKENDSKYILEAIKNVKVDDDDERLVNNKRLIALKKDIENEKIALDKASFFTAKSHTKKLNSLCKKYEEVFEEEKQDLIDKEKKKLEEQASENSLVFSGVTLGEISRAYANALEIYSYAEEEICRIDSDIYNIKDDIQTSYNEFINNVNYLIEIDPDSDMYFRSLVPCYEFLEEYIEVGRKLINELINMSNSEELKEEYRTKFILFVPRTNKQLEAYMNQSLFNICKKKIKNEFNIRINNQYKHYWYLYVYCQYLTKHMEFEKKPYIYIDEAQDLSETEIELIYRINYIQDEDVNGAPVINLFGDTKQMITGHGITNWNQVDICEQYTLNENFRNSNQIIDYCNEKLKLNMAKVGVDADVVREFDDVKNAVENDKKDSEAKIFIVKDEYAEQDLRVALKMTDVDEYSIYTVKMAKGLEFKKVYVVDANMSDNEKYISYTRALSQLYVIKTLPELADRNKKLILQGDSEAGEDITGDKTVTIDVSKMDGSSLLSGYLDNEGKNMQETILKLHEEWLASEGFMNHVIDEHIKLIKNIAATYKLKTQKDFFMVLDEEQVSEIFYELPLSYQTGKYKVTVKYYRAFLDNLKKGKISLNK